MGQDTPASAGLPSLSDLTVLEVSGSPGAAFAAVLLADFGARVIVVEPPGSGSALRSLGSSKVQDAWWPILARNKLSLAIDTARPECRPVLDRLAAAADIIIRDRAEPAWQAARERADSRALDLFLFPPGADQPDQWTGSTRPELAAAASGAMALTGLPNGAPVQTEFPLADYTAGTLAAASALFELVAARAGARNPAALSVGLHEALARMNEWQLVFATGRGFAEQRNGNRFPLNANIGNIFRTRDNRLVTISAATPAVATRLLLLVGGQTACEDARFATHAARRENMDALELLIAAWMDRHDLADVLRLGGENDVVIGPIYEARDLIDDAHVRARENVVQLPRHDGSSVSMPGIVPRIAGVNAELRRVGPAIGQDSDDVLASLGFTSAEIAALRDAGCVQT